MVEVLDKADITPKTSSLYFLAAEYDARMADTELTRNAAWRGKTRRMQELIARKFGYELNERTNFRVGRENLPALLRHPGFRLLSPYKSFLTNAIKTTLAYLGPRGLWKNKKRAARFVGMTFALAGVAGNPVMWAVFMAFAAAAKELWDIDLKKEFMRKRLYRGLSGYLGFDISGAVAIHLPTPERPKQILGRFGQYLLERGTLTYQRYTDRGTLYTERRLQRLKVPAAALRVYDAINMYRRGQYVSPITRTPIPIMDESVGGAAIKRALGFLPTDIGFTFEMERMARNRQEAFKSISRDWTARFVSAVMDKRWDDATKVFTVISKRMLKATKKLAGGKTMDAQVEGLTDLLFIERWLQDNKKFVNEFRRQTIPRDINRVIRAPTYMRPEAAVELVR
jgi:hypothetical protein